MRVRNIIDSFNYAIQGIVYALRTQRNMRIHFTAAFFMIILSLFFNFSRLELLILFFTISLVIVTEMVNTAIEKTIDMITKEYHQLAEIAKNVAAGAVLIASVNAIIVAYLLFFDRINPYTKVVLVKIKNSPIHLSFISLTLVIMVIIIIKTKTKTGTPFQGGIISGHTALAFSVAATITIIGENTLLATLSFFIAILVGESRIEGKIHTLFQVLAGAIVGILITIIIFQFMD